MEIGNGENRITFFTFPFSEVDVFIIILPQVPFHIVINPSHKMFITFFLNLFVTMTISIYTLGDGNFNVIFV